MKSDELFMLRALELATRGEGQVGPNPQVGCVVVYNEQIIGEGWHKIYGEAHAEVNAIESVTDKNLLSKCSVYVNLEPCSHTGKTPPCADLLITHEVKHVYIANRDPNPLVSGRGIKKLTGAGIAVTEDVLKYSGEELNKRFFTFHRKKRPYVILKWAQTSDGFIAKSNFNSKWISNEDSRRLVHKWRAREDAILVGKNTVTNDNPQLNVREWKGKNPTRIVIDPTLELDHQLNIFDQSQPTLCYNYVREDIKKNLMRVKLSRENFLNDLIHDLYKRNIQSLIIEGGAHTFDFFVKANLWDEARVFTSATEFGDGIPAPKINGEMYSSEMIYQDELKIYKNKAAKI